MDRFVQHVGRWLGLLLLVFCGPSWAYYVNLDPPTNWIPKELSPWPGYAALIVRAQTGTNTQEFGGEEEWERARRCSALWTGGTGRPMGSGPGGSVGGGSGGGSGVSNMGMWWRPGCDGPAFHLNSPGVFRGVRTSSVDSSAPYGDPFLDWLWRLSPGSEAQAFVPAAVYAGSLVSAALRVGGRTIFVPAFLKYAPTAGRAISKQVWRGAAVTVVAGLLGGLADYIWDDLDNRWKKPAESDISDGYEYRFSEGYSWQESARLACVDLEGYLRGLPGREGWKFSKVVGGFKCEFATGDPKYPQITYDLLRRTSQNCPAGWHVTPAGCLQNPQYEPVPEEEFITETEWIEWPEEVPEHLPDGLPVESPPKINPLPSPWDPPSPYFDPVGDPVKNPKYNPDLQPGPDNPPWVQPGRRIKPATTTENPWQVDVEPVEKPVQEGPDGKPLPDPEPTTDPTKNPANPSDPPSPGQTRPDLKPSERTPLLCEVFPWILACASLDEIPDVDLGKKEVPLSLNPDAGWGGGGSCPAARSITVQGRLIPIPFDLFCQFMEGIRPVILAMAWLSAAFIVVGGFRQGD